MIRSLTFVFDSIFSDDLCVMAVQLFDLRWDNFGFEQEILDYHLRHNVLQYLQNLFREVDSQPS
jgi:hypothetical protein